MKYQIINSSKDKKSKLLLQEEQKKFLLDIENIVKRSHSILKQFQISTTQKIKKY